GKKVRNLGKKPENGNFWGGNGSGMAFSPDGKTLVATSGEFANAKQKWHVVLYDTATGNELRRITNEDQNGNPVSPTFTPDGTKLIWAKWDGSIHVAETATGKLLHEHKGQGTYGVSDLVVTSDGKTLMSRSPNSGLRMLDVATGKATNKFDQTIQQQFWGYYGNGRGGLALSNDGKLVAMTSQDHAVRVFDLAANKEREFGEGHRSAVARVSYTDDGKTAFTQSQDGTHVVWDAATGKKQRQFKAPMGAHHFALSPDGKLLLAAHNDNTVHLHDTKALNKIHKLEGAKEGVGSLAFSADGKTAAV